MPPASRLPKVRASELVGRGWLNTGGWTLCAAERADGVYVARVDLSAC